jgi:chaperonin GroEL
MVYMKESPARRVVFCPAARQGLQRGIHQMVAAVRPTLGPVAGTVALAGVTGTSAPEILDDAGTIARRIIEIGERDADMGAMLVRELLWGLREQTGDGAATAAVILQSIYDGGMAYLASGGSAPRLREALENGMCVVLAALTALANPAVGKVMLAQIAESLCYDRKLAGLLGEIFDIIGEYGQFDIKPGNGRELDREYVEGMYWAGGLFAREMMDDPLQSQTVMENAAILISDLEVFDPRQVVSALETAMGVGIQRLLILGTALAPGVVALLASASREPEKFRVIAVRAPKAERDQYATMADMAILTGGRPLLRAAGHTLARVTPEDFGHARRVWADPAQFGLVGGKGDPRRLRAHIADLRALYGRAENVADRDAIQARIGKLLGGSAILYVGAVTETERAATIKRAERVARALRGARLEGVVPGGGAALLACQPAVQALLDVGADVDERAAYRILVRAMEEPMRAIAGNAGYEPAEVMGRIRQAGPGYGFDVTSGQVVDMAQAGIFDVVSVVRAAVRGACTTAALALSVDVLVHHKKRERMGPIV